MTTTTSTGTDDRGPECANCPSSREGCEARQVAKYGRCCTQCTHGRAAADPVVRRFLATGTPSMPRYLWQISPACDEPIFRAGE